MDIHHTELADLLQQAYSAEKAAAFAYQGHAGSLKSPDEIKAVREIEQDEWNHRREVGAIMDQYRVPVSRYYEMKFHCIGKIISWSCYVIGRFMPFYFAGRLESGNVCEYFRMKEHFNRIGIHDHDTVLVEMGMKEKEHEMYFGEVIRYDKFLPVFETVFGWSFHHSFNNINPDLETQPVTACKPRENFIKTLFQNVLERIKVG